MMPAIKKAFDLKADDMVNFSRKNGTLKLKFGSYHQKWLVESKTKLLKLIDDEKRVKLIMSRKQSRWKKN